MISSGEEREGLSLMHETHTDHLGLGFPHGAVFRASLDAVIVMDASGTIRDWNPSAEALFGYSRDEALGQELAELIIPGPLRDAHRNGLERYLETGEMRVLNRRLEFAALRSDGSEVGVELAVRPAPEIAPPLFVGFLRELEARAAGARDSVRMQQRMAFLAEAGLVLDRSLDYNDTLRRLTDLTIPDLAQLTVIDLVDERGHFELTVAASQEPDQARAVEMMREANGLDLSSGHPVALVLRNGEPMLLPAMSTRFLSEIAQSHDHFKLMRSLRYHSAIVVPLTARSHTLGTLSLLRLGGAPSYNDEDLVLARELARRAALAVDNARLFEATRHLAHTLQESLLPHVLPEIPGVRMTGRYRAAERGQEIGGDFYDSFPVGEQRWGITIGDVSGKGPEAASLTALARYTIRAYADHDPSTVLRRLNEAVIRERDVIQGRLLTALYAVAKIEDDALTLEIAVGGHPAPLVMREGGVVEQVAATGPLIGMTTDVEYSAERVVLNPGDAMLLYTDGLTDAQAPERILSDSDLRDLLTAGYGLEGERLAKFIEERATDGRSVRDDIALLVIEVPREFPSVSHRPESVATPPPN